MKFIDILISASLALVVTLGLRYIINQYTKGDPAQQKVAGKILTIEPHNNPELLDFKPSDYEIDFIDEKPVDFESKQTVVSTSYGEMIFSSEGAAIDSLVFKRQNAKNIHFNVFQAQGREDKLFLLALNEKTPYYYRLVEHKDLPDRVDLKYSADFAYGKIIKQFSISKNICKISTQVGVEYLPEATQKKVRARFVLQAPMLKDLADDQPKVFFDDNGTLRIYSNYKEIIKKMQSGPIKMFGLEDKYFAFSLINDPEQFVQRGYFKDMGLGVMRSYLQSSWISTSGVWNLSFYVGPKQPHAISAVDDRLEQILDFGYLAPISKVLYTFLMYLFNFLKSFGWAIVLLTILLKLLLLPFTWKTDLMMAKSKNQQDDLSKKLAYIDEKYKNDPQTRLQERSELMRKHGLPKIGGGCLPMLFNLVVFISLNKVLSTSIDLYKAPFLWISDLSSKDPLYLLPILLGVTIVLGMQSSLGKDPKQWFMPYAIALMMTTFMMQFSAGVVLFGVVVGFAAYAQTYFVRMYRQKFGVK
jgi:YidC/Oxa1 family membrane protein insertase